MLFSIAGLVTLVEITITEITADLWSSKINNNKKTDELVQRENTYPALKVCWIVIERSQNWRILIWTEALYRKNNLIPALNVCTDECWFKNSKLLGSINSRFKPYKKQKTNAVQNCWVCNIDGNSDQEWNYFFSKITADLWSAKINNNNKFWLLFWGFRVWE